MTASPSTLVLCGPKTMGQEPTTQGQAAATPAYRLPITAYFTVGFTAQKATLL